jgi:hypothetical protein
VILLTVDRLTLRNFMMFTGSKLDGMQFDEKREPNTCKSQALFSGLQKGVFSLSRKAVFSIVRKVEFSMFRKAVLSPA